MQIVDSSIKPVENLAVKDLGPLSWVLEELRKSFDASNKALKRFVVETKALQSDLATVDVQQLRTSKTNLHQAKGALKLLEQIESASISEAMEAVVNKFTQHPLTADDDSVGKLEYGSFAILEYLESLLAGKAVSSVGLFSQYSDIKALTGLDKTHPADLWTRVPFAWHDPAMPSHQSMQYSSEVRSSIDTALLKVMQTSDSKAANDLCQISLGLAQSQKNLKARVFWKICAAFFEAIAQQKIPVDIYAKRTISGIVVHYNNLKHGDWVFSDKFMHNMLFFCDQAQVTDSSESPCLSVVRGAWSLTTQQPVDYSKRQFGHFDPALLALSRKRISAAKELWTLLSSGNIQKIRSTSEQFKLVSESLLSLYPSSQPLADAMLKACDLIVFTKEPPSAELAMEVATAILYLETVFEGWSSSEYEMQVRATKLAQRLERVRNGGQSETVEPWIEELYRRVSDKESMGSVVGELRLCLSDLEKSIDQFFRNPGDKQLLINVPNKLGQMKGIFSVLGLDQAASAVVKMRERVEEFESEKFDFEVAKTTGQIDGFGNNLGALGFLIDMLNYQPALVKRLFVYDSASGDLSPLMGREAKIFENQEKEKSVSKSALSAVAISDTDTKTISKQAQELNVPVNSLTTKVSQEEALRVKAQTEEKALAKALAEAEEKVLAAENSITEQKLFSEEKVESKIEPEAKAFLDIDTDVFAEALAKVETPAIEQSSKMNASFLTVQKPIAQEQQQKVKSILSADELELRSIFLEEATEVIVVGLQASRDMLDKPESSEHRESQSVLRRAFHTLKGSARMVGLDEFGEAGWSFEQLVNTRLADQKPFESDFCKLCVAALKSFDLWAKDIQSGVDSHWKTETFQHAADLMRIDNKLDLTGLAQEEMVVEAGVEEPVLENLGADVDIDALSDDEALMRSLEDFELQEIPDITESDEQEILKENIKADVNTKASSPADVAFKELDKSIDKFEITADVRTEAVSFIDASEANVKTKLVASDVSDMAFEFESAFMPKIADEDHKTFQAADEKSIEDFKPLAQPKLNDEQFKVIGSLKIGIPLYNVYLNEADEWSRFLVTELEEWSLEPHRALPMSAVSYAHSLAGSSATVGFSQLSKLAKLIERSLDKLSKEISFDPRHVKLLVSSAEECRRLLHQFAAGFLVEPKSNLMEELELVNAALAKTKADSAFKVTNEETEPFDNDEVTSDIANSNLVETQAHKPDDLNLDRVEKVKTTAIEQIITTVISSEPVVNTKNTSNKVSFASIASDTTSGNNASSFLHRNKPSSLVDNDDDIEQIDALDIDLAQIFEEEAQELLPSLGSALRQWTLEPENLEARSEILRVLHTLKGSSRLAGAMRLGELTHRMESEIEELGTENLTVDMLEPLTVRLDIIQQNFDALRGSSDIEVKAIDAEADTPNAEDKKAQLVSHTSTSPKVEVGQTSQSASSISTDSPVSFASSPSASNESTVEKVAATDKSYIKPPATTNLKTEKKDSRQSVRVRARLLDRLVSQAGEVMLTRTRIESELGQLRGSLGDLTGNLDRLRQQLRDVEFQAETQMQTRMEQSKDSKQGFDPLEFDRFTRVQELTRMMAESVNDVATVQRNLQRTVDSTEDDLVAQARQTRDLQRDLLRTRMEEFESISDRLYRVVRQASKDTNKQVKLDIVGGSIEVDRGVLERMTPSFEHLLRNCVAHGVENAETRVASGKEPIGTIEIKLIQDGNDVVIEFTDDGAGLNYDRIREKAISQNLIDKNSKLSDADAINLIFAPGLSTAANITELSGRGIGLDVVRTDIISLGGRIDVSSEPNKGSRFKLVLPLTTAVTQVVMMRSGNLSFGVPSHLVEVVRRAQLADVEDAYTNSNWKESGDSIPFFWSGALLQASQRSSESLSKTNAVIIFRSAGQRIAMHVDEIFGNKEVVIKNLGPQLSRLPGLAGMAILVSGAVALIYNPVALAGVYGSSVIQFSPSRGQELDAAGKVPAHAQAVLEQQTPLVLVVDDSITVRRVTQRMLQREGFRVVLAVDGLQAIEKLNLEIPDIVLSDIEMPRMDGFDLVRNIRSDAKLKHLPIVMITSRIAEKHRELAIELGVNDYLGKPYSEEGLLNILRQHTAQKIPSPN